MKKLLASACAVAALSIAAPASAQSGIFGDIIQSILSGSSNRVDNIDDRIRVAYQRGEISQSEARDLESRAYQLRDLEQRYRQNGLTQQERYDLQRRVADLQNRFERARYDGDNNNRDWDNDNDWADNRDRCPPGLRKKNNGCMPPGQVGRQNSRYNDGRYNDGQYNDGRYNDDNYAYRNDERYVWQQDRNGRMLQIDRRTGQVVRVVNR